MKKYKVRITKQPMKMGGLTRYQTAGEIPQLTPEEEALMRYYNPETSSYDGAVTLAPTDANYPLSLDTPLPQNTEASTKAIKANINNSIYDYLTQVRGESGSYAYRKKLAKEMGIANYRGTAEQNLQMLAMLQAADQDGSSSVAGAPASMMQPRSANSVRSASRPAATQASQNVYNRVNERGEAVDAYGFTKEERAAYNAASESTPGQAASSDPYFFEPFDINGNFKYAGKKHPRLDQIIGGNYYPEYDARHQPWSPNTGLTEDQHRQLDKNADYIKSKQSSAKKEVKHSLLNNITNALTGSRSYDEYAKKNPYFFNFLGVDKNSPAFVKAIDSPFHALEDEIAKAVYNGDPHSIGNLIALAAMGRGRISTTFPGKGGPGIPPRGLPGYRGLPGGNPPGGRALPGLRGLPGREDGGEMFAYGGQSGHGLDLGVNKIDNEMGQPNPYEVRDTLQPVPRDLANLEAEAGETAYGDIDGDGEMEHSKIGGKRHSQGGTPLNLKPGTFIFSDTRSMKLKGQDLAQFGKSVTSKKGYTPAELAKQYEINKYKSILEDPNADPYQKRTAEMMMDNNNYKLAQLALAQEAKKGFPQGIPQVAMPALPPELAEQLLGMQEQAGQEQQPEAAEYARRGGSTFSGNAWYGQGGEMIRRADGSYSRRGLWDNIRANAGSGKKPTPEMLEQERRINRAEYGGIHLDPAKKGTFKAQATRMGMSTQEAAAHILANKDDYSPEMIKKAVFARNFAKEDGGLVEYQKKGEVRLPVFSNTDRSVLNSLMPTYNVGMPVNARFPGTVPAMQYRNKSGVFGEENFWDAAHQADFRGRFPEWFQNAPTWNPKIPGATKAFQLWANQQRIARGLSPLTVDDKFGEFTYSTPSFNPYLKTQAVPQPVPVNVPVPEVNNKPYVTYWSGDDEAQMEGSDIVPEEKEQPKPKKPGKEKDMFKMLAPDKLAILQSLLTSANVPVLSPFVQAPDYKLMDAVYADPTRQYAAIAEQANMQNQLQNTFGRPQASLAGSSQIAGKQIEGISNIGASNNQQNVGIANQVNAQNAAIINQNLAQRAQANNMLAEMANKYNVENFSMADAASKQTLAAYQNAWNNRAMADMIGKSNPYYMMDPTTGRTIFKGGRNPFVDRAASATSGNPFAAYQSYVDQAMKSGMTKEQAHDIVAKMFTGSRSNSVDSNYDGIPDRMTSAYNPYMAMFNQNMGGMNAMLASLLGR